METIYWITRLDGLNDFFIALIIICTVASIISFIGWVINSSDLKIKSAIENDASNKSKISNKEFIETQITTSIFRRVFIIAFPVLLISIFCKILTPSTKEAFAIYGIGGTIDYIKSNETAKQLPDKCIEALSKYVDSINEENKNEE